MAVADRVGEVDTEGPIRVGSRATEVRKVPGGTREISYEITAHDPPGRVVARRQRTGSARRTVTVEPSGSGLAGTLALEFDGHGIGKLLLPLVRRDAQKHVPGDQPRLKERLESGL